MDLAQKNKLSSCKTIWPLSTSAIIANAHRLWPHQNVSALVLRLNDKHFPQSPFKPAFFRLEGAAMNARTSSNASAEARQGSLIVTVRAIQAIGRSTDQCRLCGDDMNRNALHQILEAAFSSESFHKLCLPQDV